MINIYSVYIIYYYVTIKIKINNSRLFIKNYRRKKMNKSENYKKKNKNKIKDKRRNKGRNLFNIQQLRITMRKSIRRRKIKKYKSTSIMM